MQTLPEDFKDFLKLLNKHKVEYLLVGGYAVAFYGYIRATEDMDIWIGANVDNAKKIIAALKEFGIDASKLSDASFLKDRQVIRMGLPPFRIEVLTGISGVNFEDCYKNRLEETIDGVVIHLIHLKDLKKNKQAAGRLNDLNDLAHLK